MEIQNFQDGNAFEFVKTKEEADRIRKATVPLRFLLIRMRRSWVNNGRPMRDGFCWATKMKRFVPTPVMPTVMLVPHIITTYHNDEVQVGDNGPLSSGGSPSTSGIADWKKQEAGSEGSCCGDWRQPRPSWYEGRHCRCAFRRDGMVCPCSGQQPDEVGSFRTPTSTNVDA